MKGFAKIFEAIIASVILLASLTFFFSTPSHKSGWDDANLQVLAEDTLQNMYLNGTLTRFVKTDNRTELNNRIADILPRTVDFSIDVKGIPNSIIYVACVDCTSADTSELLAIFNTTNFGYKGRNISVRVQNLSFNITPIPDGTNILFFFDKSKIAAYQPQIKSFLESGGSAFLLSTLAQADVQGPIGPIFNLTWSTSSAQPALFDDVFNGSKTSHYVARYYANISGRYIQDVSSDTFSFFPSSIKAENDDRDVAKAGSVYVRASYFSRGRTIWFEDYDRTNHNQAATARIDRLLKSSIMWASGELFKLDTTKKDPAPVNFRSSIFVYDGDAYIVELIVWRVYF